MQSRFAVLAALVVVSAMGAGCATKGWVRETVGKERTQTDSQIAGVEGRVGLEAKRAEQTTARVGEIERSVEGFGRATQAAQERADAAFARADQTDQRLTRLWSKRHERQQVETLDVLFGFDRADLDDGAQTALLNIVRELRANQNLSVDLTGYADPAGAAEYNVRLSQRRVESVRRFLVQRGIELPRINSVGMGVLPDAGVPNDKKRRVTLRLMVAAAE
ncbi:MAG TPA: OmpA family protein [Methylomirabilota bacterium]|nr:OmpA family protein [Methylomirabilota bacterium]